MPQNYILKTSIQSLGYNFIDDEYLPKGENEFYLRNEQRKKNIAYRKITAEEIKQLEANNNTSNNWDDFFVSEGFNPTLIKNCKFYGLIRVGKIEECCLTYKNLKAPAGIYNSTIISCDIGNNVIIDNVNYLSHYIIGDETILVNINELSTTQTAKFGNGIVKKGEDENIRIWLELCNENTGRSVMPFSTMLPGDAYMWTKYRDDEMLMAKFKQFTEEEYSNERGYYGMIGERTVIKNCVSIKDTWIGTDAYIKGANKLKNLTIHSNPDGRTQIGEGCELVNGIIHEGCRIFYGAKAVRFIMASHSQLKYGARLINSYLGNNSTISCCEVLNSLIFPFHEQHHNNSFLCASMVMGQSNIAAGATIGSNHNSRGADGEIVAGRGFWPGLCVSLKHNSRFASFTIIAKSDYLYELNIPLPFSLVSNDIAKDKLIVMPAYWFLYNMYALERNAWKYTDRDKRTIKEQHIEFSYLAPDTVNEMFAAIAWMEETVGRNFYAIQNNEKEYSTQACRKKGAALLKVKDAFIKNTEFTAQGFENSSRKVVIVKMQEAYDMFCTIIEFYGINHLINFAESNNAKKVKAFMQSIPQNIKRSRWINIGGQLMPETEFNSFKNKIHKGVIKGWQGVHAFYVQQSEEYAEKKMLHALASLKEIKNISLNTITSAELNDLLAKAITIKTNIAKSIASSREKDYSNPFRKMVYDTQEEMDKVIGRFEDNSFIKQQTVELKSYKLRIAKLKKKFILK